jgi:hypothetical protein
MMVSDFSLRLAPPEAGEEKNMKKAAIAFPPLCAPPDATDDIR